MLKIDAIAEANQKKFDYGGRWHVIRIGDEYYDVHDSWFKFHDHHDEIVFSHPEEEKIVKKLSVVERLIVKFNTFLLWLFKRLVDVKRDNSKT